MGVIVPVLAVVSSQFKFRKSIGYFFKNFQINVMRLEAHKQNKMCDKYLRNRTLRSSHSPMHSMHSILVFLAHKDAHVCFIKSGKE